MLSLFPSSFVFHVSALEKLLFHDEYLSIIVYMHAFVFILCEVKLLREVELEMDKKLDPEFSFVSCMWSERSQNPEQKADLKCVVHNSNCC